MSPLGSALRPMSRAESLLLTLLVVSIFINYVDRGNLSIAAPVIENELTLSPVQVGFLLSAFFWTYSLLQLAGVSGWLVDLYPVGRVFAFGFLIWSAATIATGFLSGFAALYAARLLLGAGESIAYPCYSRIFASDLQQHHRGRANAFIDAGSKLGPGLGNFLSGMLLVRFGWRWLFILLGLGGLLWLIPWLKWMPRSKAEQSNRTEELPRIGEMLRLRSAWGTFAGQFCSNYFWYFLLTWLPSYLVKERNFSIQRMAIITSAAFFATAATDVLAGWISDRYIARGVSPTLVRKSFVVGGLIGSGVLLPVAFVSSENACIALLVVACVAFGLYCSNLWAITQTLAGPLMAGRWTSVQNGIANLAGVVAPLVAGFAVRTSGSSKPAFVVTGVIVMTGALAWGLMVGRVEQVPWSKVPSKAQLSL
jgi:MFS transporter, ACS family, D-galactonate transporter